MFLKFLSGIFQFDEDENGSVVDEDVGEATQFDTVFDEGVLLSINPNAVSLVFETKLKLIQSNFKTNSMNKEKFKRF